MLPTYHFKSIKSIKKVFTRYNALKQILLGKWDIVWPHDVFILKSDEDESTIQVHRTIGEISGLNSIRSHSELRPPLAKALDIPILNHGLSEDEYIKLHGRKANDFAWSFMVMLSFGIIDTVKRTITIVPKNRAERRRLSREEVYHQMIIVKPHVHVKKRIEKILKERKAEPYFCQKVRSHLRRLSDNRTTIVKEHKRFAHLPERPQNYNATYLAMKSKVCRPCVRMELQNGDTLS